MLATLKGEIINDVFNFNRLKPCFVRASSETSNITDIVTLKNVLKESQDNKLNVTLEDDKVVSFCDEHNRVLPDIKSDEILYTALTDAVEIAPYLKNRVNNGGLAIPEAIEQDRFFQQIGDICDKAS